MDERYWDSVAPTYLAQVHDTFAADRTGALNHWLDHFANRKTSAVDFGCGVGRYLPALSPRFKVIYALDHSAGCLEEAKQANSALANVIYRKADLTKPLMQWKRPAFGICMNVLIAPDLALRTAMLQTMHRALASNAHLLVVIPSLESALYTDMRLVEWRMRDGMTHRRAIQETITDEPGSIGPVVAGVIERGGEPTKHYLREEAILMLQNAGFHIHATDKLQYPWADEFHNPPRWLRDPYPWHWLMVCQHK